MATPCPGNPACRCNYCYGMREYMLALTGADYGLPVTYRPVQRAEPPEPDLAPVRALPAPARQPWEPRPISQRHAA